MNEMTMMLAKKFIAELGSQILRPPVYNSSVFVHSSGWQTQRYFHSYYRDRTPYPLIIFARQSEGLIFLPATKEMNLAEEVLMRYWKDEATISSIEKQFSALAHKIDAWDQQLTYAFIASNPQEKLLESFAKLSDDLWKLNALVFFSIYLDKEICEKVIEQFQVNISSEHLNEIWPQAVTPTGISFEKKRELAVMSLIARGVPWESIAEQCQYIGATYHHIASTAEVKKELFARYGQIQRSEIAQFITAERQAQQERQARFDRWLRTLTPDEQKIAKFVQFAIALRDARKDYIMKSVVLCYRFAERLFEDHGIPKDLILFYGMDELFKGERYLLAHAPELRQRAEGCTILVHDDGTHEYEYGTFEENKEVVNRHYLGQHLPAHHKELKGQTGCPGVVRGRVRVIINFEEQKKDLRKGEILVTGMTRPEFVPLMKMSSGIITDEGGVTCHAAIVSRELHIPCVVGTKIATQILHDGDLVEVNADHGIVRMLE